MPGAPRLELRSRRFLYLRAPSRPASSGRGIFLTSHAAITEPDLLAKFAAKGIDKFIAHEVPLALARERYGGHFEVVMRDLHESDDLRILDYNGERAFRLFRLAELGRPILHEPG